MIGRRQVCTGILGLLAVRTKAALAQQKPQRLHAGVLMNGSADSSQSGNLEGLRRGLRQLGWTEGVNLQLDIRWGGGDPAQIGALAAELVAARPDVIVTGATPATAAVQRLTRTIPILFMNVLDPVGSGFVASFARPGGNITGFTRFDAAMAGKWLQVLKEFAPDLRRVLFLRHPDTTPDAYLIELEATARSMNMTVAPAAVRDADAIRRAVASFAGEPFGGLVVVPDTFLGAHARAITSLASQHRLPAIYPNPAYVDGLLMYGVNSQEQFAQAATYVDRIAKGEPTAELPVQYPTKFELVVNLRIARAIGLTIPPSLLARADEVIE